MFISNMDDFGKINEVYAKHFKEPYPARSCVQVARLPKDVAIEIEAVAVKNYRQSLQYAKFFCDFLFC